MTVFKIIMIAILIIGGAIYAYGVWREPNDGPKEYKGLVDSFQKLFTDPTRKVRRIGTIMIYASGILLMLVVCLSK